MLFNEATFIVPNATGIYMTNGARSEIINGFFYFADKAILAESGTSGIGGAGKTKLKVSNVTGTFTAGDTLFYKSSTATTLASGTIASVDGSYIYLDGPVWGFESAIDRKVKTVTANGTASLNTSTKQFGTASLLLDGTDNGYVLVATNNDFLLDSIDWTIEFWINRSGSPANDMVLVDMRTSAASDVAPVIYLAYSGGNYTLTYSVGGVDHITSVSSVPTGTWYHISLSRVSVVTRLFVGLAGGSSSQLGSNYTDGNMYAQGPVKVGSRYDGTLAFNGYIDDLRISRVGRYATTYTVPTAELVNDEDTILVLHFNGSNGSTEIDDDNITEQYITSTGSSPAVAKQLVLADYHQFGAEIRSLGSAAIFGNSGVTANGTGTDIKLIAFNMSHIGAGKDISDDISLVVQANEVIELNNGKVYYQTVDQNGDFRVGDSFLVNQRTGDVSFGNAQVNLSSLNELVITDGVNNTVIMPTSVHVGHLVLSGGSLVTDSGNLTIDPAGGLTTVNGNLEIDGISTFNGVTNVANITNATTSTNGALVVAGGVGIAKDVWVGGNVNIATTSYINNSRILVGTDLETVIFTATYITNNVMSIGGLSTIANTVTSYGVYSTGTVVDIWTFGDYGIGNPGYWAIYDEAGVRPGWIAYIGFENSLHLEL
jgi:hypothetical protein